MVDIAALLILAVSALAALTILTLAASHGWRAWIAFKQAELAARMQDSQPPSMAARIELADLRERIRKLEAIAAGVEL